MSSLRALMRRLLALYGFGQRPIHRRSRWIDITPHQAGWR